MRSPTKKIEDFCRTGSGGTPSRSKSEYFEAGTIPWVKSGELKARFVTNTEEAITDAAVKNSSVKLVPRGSLLIAMYGATVGEVSELAMDAATNQAICHIVPDPNVCDRGYLFQYLSSIKSELLDKRVGGGQPNISQAIIKSLEVPLPALSEQRRIAAILDKADALRAKRREAIAKLDQLLQSVFLEMFGDPVTNPKGWPQVRFSELLESIDSGTSPVCLDRSAGDNEWAVLKLSAVTRCEYDPSANKALPEGVEPDKSLEVKVGDLLFTRKNTRDLVAACAFVTDTPPRLLLPDLIFRFRLKPLAPVVPRYLQALLAFPGKRKDIQSLAGGSAGSMPNISKAKLSNALIELPPTDLQCEFDRRLKHCDLLREQQRLALAKLDKTFFSLQQQAFAGQL
ncbi:restriction endonuclease subunit S [Pseudomonas chlororaphis]|uniref:Restriction endonuclease subunit S n=1 Tax=Pseudomonas chlororaphis TaxID=587753 RepID=A0AB34C6W0_9PSED|nr:restriction endonuclease subunit S [Pseudomonas chlororaphis]KAA5842593.1 restriction endonuclease subunit S [Pseudomonas chlororaphis]